MAAPRSREASSAAELVTRHPRGRPGLRASGIMNRVVRVGQTAPDFALPNVDGRSVSLAQPRARGPVVLSFYRGRW